MAEQVQIHEHDHLSKQKYSFRILKPKLSKEDHQKLVTDSSGNSLNIEHSPRKDLWRKIKDNFNVPSIVDILRRGPSGWKRILTSSLSAAFLGKTLSVETLDIPEKILRKFDSWVVRTDANNIENGGQTVIPLGYDTVVVDIGNVAKLIGHVVLPFNNPNKDVSFPPSPFHDELSKVYTDSLVLWADDLHVGQYVALPPQHMRVT